MRKQNNLKQISLLTMGMIFVLFNLAFAQEQILHTPVTSAVKYSPITISAKVASDPQGSTVSEALLWYSDPAYATWSSETMTNSPNGFTAEIMEYFTTGDEVHYYIEVKRTVAGKSETVTYPAMEPKDTPLVIKLTSPKPSGKVLNAKGTAGLTIISPEPGSTISGGSFLLMITINPKERALLKKDLSLNVDGNDMIQNAEVTDEYLTLYVTDLDDGEHSIELTNKRLKDSIFRFSVTAGATPAPDTKRRQTGIRAGSTSKTLPFSGSIGTQMTYQDLNGKLHRTAQENVNLRGNAGKWRYQVRGKFSSEESNSLQPQNRYSIEISKGAMNLRLLDVYPRYNEMILWGKRTRGGELDIRGKGGSFSVVYGEMLRAVDNDVTSIDTTFNASNPAVIDDIDSTFSIGTPKRWMGAMRFSFGNPDKLNVGFTTLKVKDDVESINYPIKPKDNLVAGLDFSMSMFDRKVTLKSDMAYSLFNDNISAPGFEATDNINDIIWINQYFTPTAEDTSSEIADIFGGVLKNTLSHKTQLNVRAYGNYLQFGYYSYAKSFRTLGIPQLSTDRSGLFIRDNVTLYDGMISLSGGLTTMSDNLSDKNPITNSNLNWDFMVGLYAGNRIPNLNFTMSSASNTNEVDAVFADSKIDNSTGSYGINLSDEYTILDTKNRFNFGVSGSSGEDAYDSLNTSDQSMWNFLVVNTQNELPMITTLSYSASNAESFAGGTNLDFSNFSLIFKFNLMGGKLRPWISPRFTSKSGVNNVSPTSPRDTYIQFGYDLTDPAVSAKVDTLNLTSIKDVIVDQKQTNLNAGVEYEFLPRHNLRLDLRMTTFNESNSNRYWNGIEFASSEESVVNTDGVNTVTFDQARFGDRSSDLIVLFGYNYRF